MGLLKWIQKKGLAGRIPRDAHAQYQKVKVRNPDLSEKEIIEKMFWARYERQKPCLDEKGRRALQEYLAAGDDLFPSRKPKDLLDYCLALLHIEGNISLVDGSAFAGTLDIMVEELEQLGYTVNPSIIELHKISAEILR